MEVNLMENESELKLQDAQQEKAPRLKLLEHL
jgi:hypothetical protein